jgi:hypothetical protein
MARLPEDPAVRSPVMGGAGRGVAVFMALALPLGLGACSSVFSSLPTQLGGMPADTPQASAAPAGYPAVHDMPPPRQNAVLTESEQKQAESELTALRERQAKQTEAQQAEAQQAGAAPKP